MTTPVWQPGHLYPPGSLVQPLSSAPVISRPLDNGNFEAGLTGWDQSFEFGTGTWTAVNDPIQGPFGLLSAKLTSNPGGTGTHNSIIGYLRNFMAEVQPGQTISFSCQVARRAESHADSWENGGPRIDWFTAGMVFISSSLATETTLGTLGTGDLAGMVGGTSNHASWCKLSGSGTAPAGAAFAQFVLKGTDNANGDIWFDEAAWDYQVLASSTGLVFRAVQPDAGFSGQDEPVWPTVNGQQVIDNEVTWEAVFASRVIWEASPIMVSGEYEPIFPTTPGSTVIDGSVLWLAMDHRVKDDNCPNSTVVAIAASKIFAGDIDIIAYSATTNPLDWTSEQDAGFIPFGLQQYGATPVRAMGVYRSNLVAFNEEGFQMWQVDEDPANMALLDAGAVDCSFALSVQPVSNDLVFLSQEGVRNIGIAAASTNMQAGFFGKQIDPLVRDAIASIGEPTSFGTVEAPLSLYWPGQGQYWLFFGSEAFVLTMNGGPKDQSWSRYVFPEPIEDATVLNSSLYLRTESGLVWRVSFEALQDDEPEVTFLATEANEPLLTESGDNIILEDESTAVGIPFEGYIAWPYLDFGVIGLDKQMEGFDLVITGQVNVQFGYSQANFALVTPDYLVDGDTLPGMMIPMPLTAPSFQLRLTFLSNQEWEWMASNLYLTDQRDHS